MQVANMTGTDAWNECGRGWMRAMEQEVTGDRMKTEVEQDCKEVQIVRKAGRGAYKAHAFTGNMRMPESIGL